jgi:hypothetical protein
LRGKGDHRLGRGLLVLFAIAAAGFAGALLFERPARERVAVAFLRASPDTAAADLVMGEARPLTWRTERRGRLRQREHRRVATSLWCAHDRRRPELRMAIEYHNGGLPLASGVRTVARSWVLGRRLRADELLLECERRGV